MLYRTIVIALLFCVAVAGCSSSVPRGILQTRAILDQTLKSGDDKLLPSEYRSAEEAFKMAEALLREGEDDEAEELFQLAWKKGELLLSSIAAEKARLAEEARLKAEAEKKEEERKRALAEEQKRLAEEKLREESEKRVEKVRQERERPLPAYHTVRRGENLPQIAARQDIYNDPNLWPLLYRANRDQIKDPRTVAPGQVLKVPRNLSREDVLEARRYAQERQL